MSDEKKNIHLWQNGTNPETGRSIKIWGQKWIQILDEYEWYDYIPELDNINVNKISRDYLNYIKRGTDPEGLQQMPSLIRFDG